MLINIKPNWAKIAHYPARNLFLKITCYFYLPIEVPLIGNISKMFLERIIREMLEYFLAQLVQNNLFATFFGNIECYFCLLIVSHHTATSKKIAWVGHYFLEQIYTANGLKYIIQFLHSGNFLTFFAKKYK